MVIGFKKQFVEPILNGIKKHTIREDSKHRWNAGMLMHMATGTRTKDYNCFMQMRVSSIQLITMRYTDSLQIHVDGVPMWKKKDREQLAVADGFTNLKAFEDWWIPVLLKGDGSFIGKIIHWTRLRY